MNREAQRKFSRSEKGKSISGKSLKNGQRKKGKLTQIILKYTSYNFERLEKWRRKSPKIKEIRKGAKTFYNKTKKSQNMYY